MNGTITPQRTNMTGRFRPALTFYHQNSRGTGCAAEFKLHPAHDDVGGSLMVRVANQMAVADLKSPNPTFARFDWENSICVKLDFTDLSNILQVLRGECESAGGDRGLTHRSPTGTTRIVFRHLIEPSSAYSFELYRSLRNDDAGQFSHIIFNTSEAMGLCDAIAGSMSVVAFGIPMLIPHDTTEYRKRIEEGRNAEVTRK